TSIALTAALLPARPPLAASADPAAPAARPRGRAAAFRDLFDRPLPRRRLLEFFAFTLSFATLIGGLALFLERQFEFDVEKIGYLYAFSGLIGGLIQGGLLGRLA